MKLSERELATVLAALRLWQKRVEVDLDREDRPRVYIHHSAELVLIADDGGQFEPLSPGEIDDLCERLNKDG